MTSCEGEAAFRKRVVSFSKKVFKKYKKSVWKYYGVKNNHDGSTDYFDSLTKSKK